MGGPECTPDELAAMRSERRGAPVEQLRDVDDAALGALYRSASALVITSLYESFGFPLLEALACGCPVASSGGGSLAEYDGGHAFRFDPDSADSCAAAIRAAVEVGPGGMTSSIPFGRQFTWQKTAQRYAEIYDAAPA